METLLLNSVGKVKRVKEGGREYLVAPMVLICPGVLNGSRGSLYYPPEEIARSQHIWNNTPIVVYHPTRNGQNVSARTPGVIEQSGIGTLRNSRISKKRLVADGWFDVEKTRKVDPRVYNALVNGERMELSTGLFTVNDPAPAGSVCPVGRPYTHIARDYRADHLAVLPDQKGACSLQDGCGVLVNKAADQDKKQKLTWTAIQNAFDESKHPRGEDGRWIDNTPIQFSGHKQRESELEARKFSEEYRRVRGAERLLGEAREASEGARRESDDLWRELRDFLRGLQSQDNDYSLPRLAYQYGEQANRYSNNSAYNHQSSLNHQIAGQFHEDTAKFMKRLSQDFVGKTKERLQHFEKQYIALAAMHRDAAKLLQEEPGDLKVNTFDPDQPRDDAGRWKKGAGTNTPLSTVETRKILGRQLDMLDDEVQRALRVLSPNERETLVPSLTRLGQYLRSDDREQLREELDHLHHLLIVARNHRVDMDDLTGDETYTDDTVMGPLSDALDMVEIARQTLRDLRRNEITDWEVIDNAFDEDKHPRDEATGRWVRLSDYASRPLSRNRPKEHVSKIQKEATVAADNLHHQLYSDVKKILVTPGRSDALDRALTSLYQGLDRSTSHNDPRTRHHHGAYHARYAVEVLTAQIKKFNRYIEQLEKRNPGVVPRARYILPLLDNALQTAREAAVVLHDASLEYTANTFDENKHPRGDDGRWVNKEKMFGSRSSVLDSALVESLEASKAAEEVTLELDQEWGTELLPSLEDSISRLEGHANTRFSRLQTYTEIAKSIQAAASLSRMAGLHRDYYQEQGDPDRPNKGWSASNHESAKRHLLEAINLAGKLPRTEAGDHLVKRLNEAVHLQHDAAELMREGGWKGTRNADNCGTGKGGFQPGNTCAGGGAGTPIHSAATRTGTGFQHEQPGHAGAAWKGIRSGHVAGRKAGGEFGDSQFRTRGEEFEASQGAEVPTEEAADLTREWLSTWKGSVMQDLRNDLEHLTEVAEDYSRKAALYSREAGKGEFTEDDLKASAGYHQLAAQTHNRAVMLIQREFMKRRLPEGVSRGALKLVVDRHRFASALHRDAGLMLTGNSAGRVADPSKLRWVQVGNDAGMGATAGMGQGAAYQHWLNQARDAAGRWTAGANWHGASSGVTRAEYVAIQQQHAAALQGVNTAAVEGAAGQAIGTAAAANPAVTAGGILNAGFRAIAGITTGSVIADAVIAAAVLGGLSTQGKAGRYASYAGTAAMVLGGGIGGGGLTALAAFALLKYLEKKGVISKDRPTGNALANPAVLPPEKKLSREAQEKGKELFNKVRRAIKKYLLSMDVPVNDQGIDEPNWEPINNDFNPSQPRANDGKWTDGGAGGGSGASNPNPAGSLGGAPSGRNFGSGGSAHEQEYQPRKRLTDAEGGESYTFARDALQADVLTRPFVGVLGAIDSRFQTGVDKAYNNEVKEVFKAIFSRMTLGTGPLAVKAVAAGARHSPRLFRLLVQGLKEAGAGVKAVYQGVTGNSDNCGTGAGGFKPGNTCAGDKGTAARYGHTQRGMGQLEDARARRGRQADYELFNEELHGALAASHDAGNATVKAVVQFYKDGKYAGPKELQQPIQRLAEETIKANDYTRQALEQLSRGIDLYTPTHGSKEFVHRDSIVAYLGAAEVKHGHAIRILKTEPFDRVREQANEAIKRHEEARALLSDAAETLANSGYKRTFNALPPGQPAPPGRGPLAAQDQQPPRPQDDEAGEAQLTPSLKLLLRILKNNPAAVYQLVKASKAALAVVDGKGEQQGMAPVTANEYTQALVLNLLDTSEYPLLTNAELGEYAQFDSDEERLYVFARMAQFAAQHTAITANSFDTSEERRAFFLLLDVAEGLTPLANARRDYDDRDEYDDRPRARGRSTDRNRGAARGSRSIGEGRGHFFETCDRNEHGWCTEGQGIGREVDRALSRIVSKRIGEQVSARMTDQVSARFAKHIDAAIDAELAKRLPQDKKPDPPRPPSKILTRLKQFGKMAFGGVPGAYGGSLAGGAIGTALGGPLIGTGVGALAGGIAGYHTSGYLGKKAGEILTRGARKAPRAVGALAGYMGKAGLGATRFGLKQAFTPTGLGAITGGIAAGATAATVGAPFAAPAAIGAGVGAVGGKLLGIKARRDKTAAEQRKLEAGTSRVAASDAARREIREAVVKARQQEAAQPKPVPTGTVWEPIASGPPQPKTAIRQPKTGFGGEPAFAHGPGTTPAEPAKPPVKEKAEPKYGKAVLIKAKKSAGWYSALADHTDPGSRKAPMRLAAAAKANEVASETFRAAGEIEEADRLAARAKSFRNKLDKTKGTGSKSSSIVYKAKTLPDESVFLPEVPDKPSTEELAAATRRAVDATLAVKTEGKKARSKRRNYTQLLTEATIAHEQAAETATAAGFSEIAEGHIKSAMEMKAKAGRRKKPTTNTEYTLVTNTRDEHYLGLIINALQDPRERAGFVDTLAELDRLLANFDPDQPRNPDGTWKAIGKALAEAGNRTAYTLYGADKGAVAGALGGAGVGTALAGPVGGLVGGAGGIVAGGITGGVLGYKGAKRAEYQNKLDKAMGVSLPRRVSRYAAGALGGGVLGATLGAGLGTAGALAGGPISGLIGAGAGVALGSWSGAHGGHALGRGVSQVGEEVVAGAYKGAKYLKGAAQKLLSKKGKLATNSLQWVQISNDNCGVGQGGFQPGNTCAEGDGDSDLSPEGAGVGGVVGGALGGAAIGALTGGPLGATAGLIAGGAMGTFAGAKLGKKVERKFKGYSHAKAGSQDAEDRMASQRESLGLNSELTLEDILTENRRGRGGKGSKKGKGKGRKSGSGSGGKGGRAGGQGRDSIGRFSSSGDAPHAGSPLDRSSTQGPSSIPYSDTPDEDEYEETNNLRWESIENWDESDHPRDSDGRFASGGGSGTKRGGMGDTARGLNATAEGSRMRQLRQERNERLAQGKGSLLDRADKGLEDLDRGIGEAFSAVGRGITSAGRAVAGVFSPGKGVAAPTGKPRKTYGGHGHESPPPVAEAPAEGSSGKVIARIPRSVDSEDINIIGGAAMVGTGIGKFLGDTVAGGSVGLGAGILASVFKNRSRANNQLNWRPVDNCKAPVHPGPCKDLDKLRGEEQRLMAYKARLEKRLAKDKDLMDRHSRGERISRRSMKEVNLDRNIARKEKHIGKLEGLKERIKRGDKRAIAYYKKNRDKLITHNSDSYEDLGYPGDDGGLVTNCGGDRACGCNTNNTQPSDELDIPIGKACQIVEDGQVHGKKLTRKQRGMFGARCGQDRDQD